MEEDKQVSLQPAGQAMSANREDIEPLSMYVSSVCITLLSSNSDAFHKSIHSESAYQILEKFASDSNSKILIVQKTTVIKEGGDAEETQTMSFSLEMESTNATSHSIAFLKRPTFQLVDDVSGYASTIQVINLGYYAHDASPISINHLYVQSCFLPIFNAYRAQFEAKMPNSKQAYQQLLKKLSEFNLALIQCQHNVDVPEIQLIYDQTLKERVQKIKATSGRNPVIEDFEDLLFQNDFIDSLVGCVTKWTKDIRAIIAIDYEVSSGTTLQEINYWLSYERSLNLVDQQINQSETIMTLEILKKKLKHNVTMPFEFDLKFKHTLSMCVQCNQFMKEFPLNDLLSAGSLSDIMQAIAVIFNHMKNIKNLSYAPQRSFQLLEAVSRDLNTQLIKILG